MIHLGGQAAVIVPLAEFLRLRALETTASARALEYAEDAAAAQDWLAREAGGETTYVPLPEVRRRLGLADFTGDRTAPSTRPRDPTGLPRRASDPPGRRVPGDDPHGLRAVLAAIDALAEGSYPDDAFPFGSTGVHRLRVGRYRVLYRVSDGLVAVGHIARTALD